MDNRTLEEVRNNETRLINEIKELENINNKLSSALISAEEKNKKYKEVIDKIKEYIEKHDYDYIYMDCKFIETEVYKELLDILKEVE